jgi:pseudaminic acid biosynthesis-associated protein pseG
MRKIFFWAEANAKIGYGHFVRTLALADMLKEHFDCYFVSPLLTEYQLQEVDKVCRYLSLPSNEERFDYFLSLLEGNEIVVLDNYFFTTNYQRKIKNKGCRLVCIDDMHDKHYVADVVINHGVTDVSLFSVEAYTQRCLGLQWALLREPFLQLVEIGQKEKGNWFISFGGSDPYNLTERLVRFVYHRSEVKCVSVVVGDVYQNLDSLRKYSKVIIYKNLSANQMATLMQHCEYAILPSSSICIEALSCACKVFAGYYVDNQQEFYHYLSDNYYVYGLDNYLDSSFSMPEKFDQIVQFDRSIIHGIRERYIQLFKKIDSI